MTKKELEAIGKARKMFENIKPPCDKEYSKLNEKTIVKQLKYMGAIK